MIRDISIYLDKFLMKQQIRELKKAAGDLADVGLKITAKDMGGMAAGRAIADCAGEIQSGMVLLKQLADKNCANVERIVDNIYEKDRKLGN